MDLIERIRQLISLMTENDLAELEVEQPELRVRIRSNSAVRLDAPSAGVPAQLQALPAQQPALQAAPQAAGRALEEGREPGLLEFTAPMVGTFYRAPSEGAEPYVSVGSELEPDTVVCIIEAMKVMNEIKAELSGEVVEILVQNAEPVEYGQVLFLVRPLEQ